MKLGLFVLLALFPSSRAFFSSNLFIGRLCNPANSRYCRTWGCTSPRRGEPSGLADTDEVFVAGSARVTWRRGSRGPA